MSDPTRLRDGGGDLERSLLGAWNTRQPSDEARLRTLAAVGVGSLAVATGLGSVGAGTSIAPKAALASSSLLKWLALSALVAGGVAATVGAIAFVNLHDKPLRPAAPQATTPVVATRVAKPPPSSSASPVAPAPSSTAPSPTAAAPDPLARVAPEPVDAPERSSSPGRPPSRAPRAVPDVPASAASSTDPKTNAAATTPSSPSTLDDQVSTLDQARRALGAGDANGALRLVSTYDARFPDGSLAQESAELRIEALYRLERRAEADTLAAKFLAAHPTSPYARVLRSLSSGARPE